MKVDVYTFEDRKTAERIDGTLIEKEYLLDYNTDDFYVSYDDYKKLYDEFCVLAKRIMNGIMK